MDKLTIGQAKAMGVEFVEGDKYISANPNSTHKTPMVNKHIEWINDPEHNHWNNAFCAEFTFRLNPGHQPCPDDLPVIVEFESGNKYQDCAVNFYWGSFDVKSWKPDLKAMIAKLNDRDDGTETSEDKEAFEAMESSNDNQWDGEGLPPVGVECETFCDIRKEWIYFLPLLVVTPEQSSNGIGAVYGEYWHPSDEMWCANAIELPAKFRPIETPTQKAARERGEDLKDIAIDVFGCDWLDIHQSDRHIIAKIYDAGYRKEK